MDQSEYAESSTMKRSFMFDIKLDRYLNDDSKDVFRNKFEVIGDLKGFLDFLEIGSEILKLNLMLTNKLDPDKNQKIRNQMQENFNLLNEFFYKY